MSRRVCTSWLVLLALAFVAGAEQKPTGRVTGMVMDAVNNAPLPGANVLLEGTTLGAVTRTNGVFNIDRVPPGTYRIIATLLGYRKMVINGVTVSTGQPQVVRIRLNRQTINMGNVQVRAKRETQSFDYEKAIAGHEIITPKFVARRAGALEDAYRAIAILPGVVTRSDLNTQLYIRGGSPDQNLILYDGLEITTPSRLFIMMGGGISLVNPDIIQGIDLEPAGFDVSQGGKVSALLQIANREGKRERPAIGLSIAMLTTRAVAEGVIGRNRGSWIIAGRRSFYDIVANQFYKQDYIFPFYYDFHAKVAYDLKRTTRLTAFYTHLGEGAKMMDVEQEQLDLLNAGKGHIGGLRLASLLTPRFSLIALLGYYHDDNDVQVYDTYNYRYHAQLNYTIRRSTAKVDMMYTPKSWLAFKFGGQSLQHQTDLLWDLQWRNALDLPDSIRFTSSSTDNSAYVQMRLRSMPWWEWTAGVRYDHSRLYGESHWHPRTRLLYNPQGPVSAWVSYGTYSQYPDFLTVIGRGEPLDISANADAIGAERARHYIAGLLWATDSNHHFKLELYRKELDHLLVNPNDELFVPENSGTGRAQGVELSFQRLRQSRDRFGYWINFALAEAQYKRFASDAWRYFDYDQPFQASSGGEWRLSRRWQVSGLCQYGSGFPYTPVLALQRDLSADSGSLEGWRVVKGAKNSARYDPYMRLDVRISYLYESPRRTFSAYVDLINILNRKNIYMYDWRFESSNGNGGYARRSVVYMLPFLPSFGVTVTF